MHGASVPFVNASKKMLVSPPTFNKCSMLAGESMGVLAFMPN